MMKGTVAVDVMDGERYVATLQYPAGGGILDAEGIGAFVERKLPTLKGRKYRIAIAGMRIGNNSPAQGKPMARRASEGGAYRVAAISPGCEYARYAKFFTGKLVRLVRGTGDGGTTTGWYEFLFERDSEALNKAAGWSAAKREYFLERPKLK